MQQGVWQILVTPTKEFICSAHKGGSDLPVILPFMSVFNRAVRYDDRHML